MDPANTRRKVSLCPIDALSLAETLAAVRALADADSFHYLVTPNMDHLQRLYREGDGGHLGRIYHGASLSLCDSRILEKLLRLCGCRIPEVIPGSTLTFELFERVLNSGDRILLVGGSDAVVAKLRACYPHLRLDHINPSMGFIHKPDEVEKLTEQIAAAQADFLFLAVGSPQQELLAGRLAEKLSRGLALCVGASLLFLCGDERRAPNWVQLLHCEWCYRLLQNPRRLIPRYFSNALYLPRLFVALSRQPSVESADMGSRYG